MNSEYPNSNDRIHQIYKYQLDMYRIARSFFKSEEDCKDALQEAIFKAYKNIDQVKEPSYLKTWLIKITLNECRRIYRKQQISSKLKCILERKETYTVEWDESLALRQAISDLGSKYKIPILLYYYNDCTYEEIGHILNIPIGTIRSRLNKAKNLLRITLREEPYEHGRLVRK